MPYKKLVVLFALFFLIIGSFAQQKVKNYDQQWANIDSLLNQSGLIRSALQEVDKVYTEARKTGNKAQMIKALLYKMNINDQLSENGQYENIRALEKEIEQSEEPVRSVLQSITAQSYYNYLQMNRWKFYDRTVTSGYRKEDIATWAISDLHAKITDLYQSSTKNVTHLKKTRLDEFESILHKGNTRHLRPTLYDLLAHRALNYYKNDERYIDKPAYAFVIDDSAAFTTAAKFIKHRFQTADTSSLHFQALLLFQQLLNFHLADADPAALIDLDINRLDFVRNYAVHENKDSMYVRALHAMIDQYKKHPAVAQAYLALAQWHVNNGRNYHPFNDSINRYALVTAKELSEAGLAAKDSLTGNDLNNLLKEITRKDLALETEKVNPPEEPFRMFVRYRNLTTLHVRIIRMNENKRRDLGHNTWEDTFWKDVRKMPAIKSFSVSLPDTKDHQQHGVELKIDKLPVGQYAILASPDKSFSTNHNVLSLQFVYISDIAFLNNENRYFVLNRRSGQPLSGTDVQLFTEKYDYKSKRNVLEPLGTYVTDKQGYFEIRESIGANGSTKNGHRARNYRLALRHKKDSLFIHESSYNYNYPVPAEDKAKDKTFLFTDRSIYRPGQIVYFKGIVITTPKKNERSVVVDGRKSVIFLYDANGEKVDSMSVTTNSFGSYAGKFTIPGGSLNGSFFIRDNHNEGQVNIQVEEYKRPRFQVELKKPTGTYRLNDSICVGGTATSYAGNNISGASVNYRVVRRTVTPLWMTTSYLPRIWPPRPQETMEIAHGTAETDESGNFEVCFKAIPDRKVPKEQQPLFYYIINTDVTDINGETRSGSRTVVVGYQALKLDLDLPAFLQKDSLRTVNISSTNLEDIFEPARVQLSIHRLAPPKGLFRERLWEQPDQFIMSRNEYARNFPHDPYADELNMINWPKQQTVLSDSINTQKDSAVALNVRNLSAGWYLIEARTVDRFGDTVRSKKYIRLDAERSIVSPFATASLSVNRPVAKPGEQVTIELVTNLENPQTVYDFGSAENARENRPALNRNKPVTRTITDSDVGGLPVSAFFIRHNRIFSVQSTIDVPNEKKQLNIEYLSYRDKTLPGSEERWKVKIHGHEGAQKSAELLTAMYDASLDQFLPHNWSVPPVWNSNKPPKHWNGQTNFFTLGSFNRMFEVPDTAGTVKIYDELAFRSDNYHRRTLSSRTGINQDMVHAQTAAPANKEAKVEESILEFGQSESAADQEAGGQNTTPPTAAPTIQPRTNFNETAFFFPQLITDSSGTTEFAFTTPEALTQWKWMLLAHTRDLAFGFDAKTMLTQKKLMVQPNPPRFLREKDFIHFNTKIVNTSDQEITGEAYLELSDPESGNIVDVDFDHRSGVKKFTLAPRQTMAFQFPVRIPDSYTRPVVWKIVASATMPDSSGTGVHTISDGEQAYLPVISNRMLVTETLPLPLTGTTSASFVFEKLRESEKSSSLKHHGITVEFTSNPAWFAVQALPYLTEQEKENAEAVFNRFYANALASDIAAASPRLQEVISSWSKTDTTALLSNLHKNEELKSLLLNETPWVLDAKNETEQKKRIALLFDLRRMADESKSSLTKLRQMQSPTGGFVWLPGGPEDRYMTQYIITGIGRLRQLGAIPQPVTHDLDDIIRPAIQYLDGELKKEYDELIKRHKKIPDAVLNPLVIQYLYMRSFFPDIPVKGDVFTAYNYYRKQTVTGWVKENSLLRSMIALSLFRTGDKKTAGQIMSALKESAIQHKELGMYWKDVRGGYMWQQAPIETQAVLIEAFNTVLNDQAAIDKMKTWLLKNKQTNNWRTTKATADACYALLLQGSEWTSELTQTKIMLGKTAVRSGDDDEAGTGYFKRRIAGEDVTSSMGNIRVTRTSPGKTSSGPSWGAVYWQYFEDLNKISAASTPLDLQKKLFIQKNTDHGPQLFPIDSNNLLHVGDRVIVRIELRVDRDMEYVHMKDMRASSLEPLNVLSGYKWKGGLGYYESTRDASTDFFFQSLHKGVYVFEYPLYVTHAGYFSNGITTIQCMYAPEFSSHSEGVTIKVEGK